MSKRVKKRNDIIFICALLLLVFAASLAMHLFKTEGDTVTVTVDGRLWGEYPLNEESEIEIKTEFGHNLLIIEDGCAYMKSASCPDGICANHRPISYDGESIICLPNKVVIVIDNKQDTDAPDIIS